MQWIAVALKKYIITEGEFRKPNVAGDRLVALWSPGAKLPAKVDGS